MSSAVPGTDLLAELAPELAGPARPRSSTACAPATTTGTRGRHRGAARVVAALRHRDRAARRVPGRARRGGHPEPGRRGPHRGAHRGHRGAHPAGRRDQAPGEDGHRGDLPFRRGAAAGAARARGARGRASARRAQLPGAAHARRPRPGRRPGRRLHALPDRGRSRRPTTPRSTSSTGAGSRSTCARAPTTTRVCVGTKHRVATQREVTVARGRPRRAHDGHRARGEGQRRPSGSPSCTPRFVPHLSADVARTVLQGYQGRYGALARRGHRDRRRRSTTRRLASVDLVDLLTEPVYVLADRWR